MKQFNIVRTNHTSFTVSNLDQTTAFFRDALGFEVTSKEPRDPKLIEQITGVDGARVVIAYVRGPGHSIELIEYTGPAERTSVYPRPCDVGFSHLAYDVDDIDAALAVSATYNVKKIGATVVIDKGPNKGSRIAYLRDSDGITFEFIEKSDQVMT